MTKYITLRKVKERAGPTKKARFLGYEVLVITQGWKVANHVAKMNGVPFIRVKPEGIVRNDLRRLLTIVQDKHPQVFKKLIMRRS